MLTIKLKILEGVNMSVSCCSTVCDVHYHFAILLNPLRLSSKDFKAFLIMIKELLSHLCTGLCLISRILMQTLGRNERAH